MSYTATVVRSPQPPQASTSVAPSASASLAGAARANKLGLFGMVSEECLDQIRRHVAPIKGLHAWTAQAIYTALAVSASRQGQASVADGQRCWVTIAELAARTGMGRRNIERYLPVLQDAGVIRIIHAHDTLHRPVASHYLFVYRHTASDGIPTPESGSTASPVVDHGVSTTPESAGLDSGVGTLTKSQRKRSESGPEGAPVAVAQEEREETFPPETIDTHPDSVATVPESVQPALNCNSMTPPSPVPSPVEARWTRARETLRSEVSAAAFSAWLEPLLPLPAVLPAGESSDEVASDALVLVCGSTFQREQIVRRYRPRIEKAFGGSVEFTVEPVTPPGARVGG